MKLNAGIITEKIAESKEFYLLLHTPDHSGAISFLLPDHPSQQPLFRPAFEGKGMYVTIETDHVDELYKKITALNLPIRIELRDEPWGDRHFAVQYPNGIGIDLVTYSSPNQ